MHKIKHIFNWLKEGFINYFNEGYNERGYCVDIIPKTNITFNIVEELDGSYTKRTTKEIERISLDENEYRFYVKRLDYKYDYIPECYVENEPVNNGQYSYKEPNILHLTNDGVVINYTTYEKYRSVLIQETSSLVIPLVISVNEIRLLTKRQRK